MEGRRSNWNCGSFGLRVNCIAWAKPFRFILNGVISPSPCARAGRALGGGPGLRFFIG